jgi:hypothetical protein
MATTSNSDEMSNLYRGPSINASYKVQFIWPSGFGGEDLNKSANQKQESNPLTNMATKGNSCF